MRQKGNSFNRELRYIPEPLEQHRLLDGMRMVGFDYWRHAVIYNPALSEQVEYIEELKKKSSAARTLWFYRKLLEFARHENTLPRPGRKLRRTTRSHVVLEAVERSGVLYGHRFSLDQFLASSSSTSAPSLRPWETRSPTAAEQQTSPKYLVKITTVRDGVSWYGQQRVVFTYESFLYGVDDLSLLRRVAKFERVRMSFNTDSPICVVRTEELRRNLQKALKIYYDKPEAEHEKEERADSATAEEMPDDSDLRFFPRLEFLTLTRLDQARKERGKYSRKSDARLKRREKQKQRSDKRSGRLQALKDAIFI